jgi:tetrahydromethanopterin S-methyltransferase subunit G
VVLTKDQARRFKEFAEKHHVSRSQFLRAAAEKEIERTQNGGDPVEIDSSLRPIVERLEKVEKAVARIEGRLDKTEKGVDFLVGKFGDRIEKVADDIEELLLREGRELSVPDIGDFLTAYSQEEILQGIEKLEDEFVVVRVERENGVTKWRIRGGANGGR